MNLSVSDSPALNKAIAAIHAAADEREKLARIERKARLRSTVNQYLAEPLGLLSWLWQARRYIGDELSYSSLEEAIRDLRGRHGVERRLVRERDWKARPDIAAGQWDRLLVARYLRRFSKRFMRKAA